MKNLFLWLAGLGVAAAIAAGCGGSSSLYDSGSSYIRAVSLIYGDDNLSFLNKGNTQVSAGDLPYGKPSSYQGYDNQQRSLQFKEGGAIVATIPDRTYTLAAFTTAYAVSDGAGGVDAFAINDNTTTVTSGYATVRLVHGFAGQPNLDAYVTNTPTDPLSGANRLANNVPFESRTDYLPEVVPTNTTGTFYVTVTPAGSTTPILSAVPISLTSGRAYSLVFVSGAGNAPTLVPILDYSP